MNHGLAPKAAYHMMPPDFPWGYLTRILSPVAVATLRFAHHDFPYPQTDALTVSPKNEKHVFPDKSSESHNITTHLPDPCHRLAHRLSL